MNFKYTKKILAGTFFTLLITGCITSQKEDSDPTVSDDTSKQPKLFVMQSDFQSGLLQWFSVPEDSMVDDGFALHSDSRLFSHNGYLYALERMGADNVIKFDPTKKDASGVVYQQNLGVNWNPQAMAFANDTLAYIANANDPKITLFQTTKGQIISHIDISEYTFLPDSNNTPYAQALVIAEGSLYVLLQRRNGIALGAPTLILKINMESNTVADTISLQYKNGYDMVYHGGYLYVSNPGDGMVVGDGAVEQINLATKEVKTIVDEDALGGNPNQIVHKKDSKFYVTNYVGWMNVKVIELDVATGEFITLPNVKDAFGGIYYDAHDERLYVGERDKEEMGVRVFKNNEQIVAPIKTDKSLPPTSLVIVR
jgi:hypothetical protein